MTFMDGLIILSSDGRPLITSRFTSSTAVPSKASAAASGAQEDSADGPSAGASTSASSSSALRAVYARVHADRFNTQVLRAIAAHEHARVTRPRRPVAPGCAHARYDRSAASSGKGKGRAVDEGRGDAQWFGSAVLQEAFAGQAINNEALEGPDPLGRDDDLSDEDYGGGELGLGDDGDEDGGVLDYARVLPATGGYQLPRIASLDDLPPILWVSGVPPLSSVAADGAEAQSSSAGAQEDLLAPTPVPVPEQENAWAQQQSSGPPQKSAANTAAAAASDEAEYWDPFGVEDDEEEGSGTCLFHKRHNDLHFLIPVSNAGVPPLLPITFLSHFIRLLILYVSPSASSSNSSALAHAHLLTSDTLKSQFDTVYALLEEMLDDGGAWPLTTEPMILRELVPAEQGGWRRRAEVWAEKLMGATSLSAQQSSTAASVINSAISSPVPWRMPALRYMSNEIFIDVVERLEGTVGRDGRLRRANLYASILCRSRLSGMPEILVALSKAEQLREPSFHPCVRMRNWTKEQILSFIPPDGPVWLANFRVGDAHAVPLFDADTPDAATMPLPMPSPPGKLADAPPLRCSCTMRGGAFDYSAPDGEAVAMRTVDFEIELEPRLPADVKNQQLQEVVVSFELPDDAANVDAVLVGEDNSASSAGSAAGAHRDASTAGAFLYDTSLHVLRWSIPSVRRGVRVRLKGSFETYSLAPRPASNVTVQCQAILQGPQGGLSGVRVDSIHLNFNNLEGYKPFKGVRNVLVTDLEYRWS